MLEKFVKSKWTVLGLLLVSHLFALGLGSKVQAQFLPPPPVLQGSSPDGFNASDRRTLEQIYLLTRSVRARLFPLQEEQRVLDLTK